jgi:hypothetical protein
MSIESSPGLMNRVRSGGLPSMISKSATVAGNGEGEPTAPCVRKVGTGDTGEWAGNTPSAGRFQALPACSANGLGLAGFVSTPAHTECARIRPAIDPRDTPAPSSAPQIHF